MKQRIANRRFTLFVVEPDTLIVKAAIEGATIAEIAERADLMGESPEAITGLLKLDMMALDFHFGGPGFLLVRSS